MYVSWLCLNFYSLNRTPISFIKRLWKPGLFCSVSFDLICSLYIDPHPALLCEQREFMHENENRWIFLLLWRTREGEGVECTLLFRDTAASIRGKKALIVEVNDGGRKDREWRGVRREMWREGDISLWQPTTLLKGTRTKTKHFKSGSQFIFLYIWNSISCAVTRPSMDIWQAVLKPQAALIIVIPIQAVHKLMGINKPGQRMPRFTTKAEKIS